MSVAQLVLALIGGVGGSLLLRVIEAILARRRDDRDLLSVVRLLRDEIRHNIGVLHALGELNCDPDDVEPVKTATYDQHASLLARLLPPHLRIEVARLYSGAARVTLLRELGNDNAEPDNGGQAGWDPRRQIWVYTKDQWVQLDVALRALARKLSKGTEPEVGPNHLGGWQPVDPKTGLTPYDLYGHLTVPPTKPAAS